MGIEAPVRTTLVDALRPEPRRPCHHFVDRGASGDDRVAPVVQGGVGQLRSPTARALKYGDRFALLPREGKLAQCSGTACQRNDEIRRPNDDVVAHGAEFGTDDACRVRISLPGASPAGFDVSQMGRGLGLPVSPGDRPHDATHAPGDKIETRLR